MTIAIEKATSYEAIASENEQLHAQVFRLRHQVEALSALLAAYREEVGELTTLLENKEKSA